jgi:small-conductance mechanosensitive channel
MPRFLTRLAVVLLAGLLAGPVWAAPPTSDAPAPSALSLGQVEQTLAVLKDERRRAALIGELETIAQALPATPPAAQAASPAESPAAVATDGAAPAAAKSAAGATSAAPAAKAPAASPLPLAHDGLAWRLAVESSAGLQVAGRELATTVQAVNDLPALGYWLSSQAADPAARARVAGALWRVAVVLAGGLAAEWVAIRVLRRLRAALARWAPATAQAGEDLPPGNAGIADAEAGETEAGLQRGRLTVALHLLRRLPFSVGRLLLDLLPVAVFAGVGTLLLGGTSLGALATTRFAARAVLDAYVFCRAVVCVVRMLVAPRQPRLRLVHVSDEGARFAVRLTRAVVGIGAAGNAVGQVGLMLGMYPSAELAWIKLVALVVHLILIGAVLHVREPVARRLRAPPGQTGWFARLRDFVAARWHRFAIFWLVAIWLVWAVEIQDGFSRLVEFFLTTSAVLIAARLAAILLLGGLDRLFKLGPEALGANPGLEARASLYYPVVRQATVAGIGALTVLALLQAWGLAPLDWLARSRLGEQALSALALIVLTVVLAAVAWEAANLAIERYLARLSREDQLARAGRLRTLLPFLRTTLLVAILVIVGLTVLSQVGVNIAPLLAGAGVIGIAVGFGSQKLVQDLITGLFLLLEDAMQVGDWVTVAGLSGTVETLSIRTIRLRAGDGSMHIIPFSSVTTVNNTNRDFAYAAVSVGVAYKEDTDRVGRELGDIVAAMRDDPLFRDQILGDFSLWGVDQLGDYSVTIKGQVQTTAGGRWPVQREINRRVKKRFEALGIEIPYPVHTVLLGDEAGHAPAAHVSNAHAPPPPRTDLASPPPAAMGNTA